MPTINAGNILTKAQEAIALVQQGREALAAIKDALNGGQVALNTNDMRQLQALLAQEQRESEAAHSDLNNAIIAARG